MHAVSANLDNFLIQISKIMTARWLQCDVNFHVVCNDFVVFCTPGSRTARFEFSSEPSPRKFREPLKEEESLS